MVALNNARNVLNALKTLTWTGNISRGTTRKLRTIPCTWNPPTFDTSRLRKDQYMSYINLRLADKEDKTFDRNILRRPCELSD
jgi:hypothetical protein